jgi:hypothetical protein
MKLYGPLGLDRWLLILLLVPAGTTVVQAQTPASCDTSYAQAEEAYFAANFETAEALLRPCAREVALQDSVRARMYRLLSFVYLGQNDSGAARRAVESLLDLQPTYTPNPAEDRPDFVALVQKSRKARQAKAGTKENDRRWVRWALGAGAAAVGTAAVLLLRGGGSGDGPEPLPRPQPPPE